MRPAALLAILFAFGLAAGCYARDAYTVDSASLRQVAALPPVERERAVVSATREADGKKVQLRTRSIPLDGVDLSRDTPVHVTAYELNRTVAIAQALTYIGGALSVVGTLGFLTSTGDTRTAFGVLALIGEPPMLTGTVLWPYGLTRPPQEVRSPSPALRYIPPLRF